MRLHEVGVNGELFSSFDGRTTLRALKHPAWIRRTWVFGVAVHQALRVSIKQNLWVRASIVEHHLEWLVNSCSECMILCSSTNWSRKWPVVVISWWQKKLPSWRVTFAQERHRLTMPVRVHCEDSYGHLVKELATGQPWHALVPFQSMCPGHCSQWPCQGLNQKRQVCFPTHIYTYHNDRISQLENLQQAFCLWRS